MDYVTIDKCFAIKAHCVRDKNCLSFYFQTTNKKIKLIRLTVRPSGTEPKIKMYFELGSQPLLKKDMSDVDFLLSKIVKELEIDFMIHCYKLIDIKFPKRGFKLFSQIPLPDKLKYFEIENEIVKLKIIEDKDKREKRLNSLLLFLGSNPIEKVDLAFQEKYKVKIKQYLNLI
jgi:phosphoglucomutase